MTKATDNDFEFDEFTRWCRRLCTFPAYRASIEVKAQEGRLTDKEEDRIWMYAWGRPSQPISLKVTEDLANMSHEELLARAKQLASKIKVLTGEDDEENDLVN